VIDPSAGKITSLVRAKAPHGIPSAARFDNDALLLSFDLQQQVTILAKIRGLHHEEGMQKRIVDVWTSA